MIGLFIKKVFFNAWDNFITTILVNIGFIVVFLLFSLSVTNVKAINIFTLLIIVFLFLLINLYAGGASFLTSLIVTYELVEKEDIIRCFKKALPYSITFFGISLFQIIIIFIAIPFYFAMGGIIGLGAMVLLFWVNILWCLAAQYYFPVAAQIGGPIPRVLQKTLYVFFDNTLFTILLAIYSGFLLLISLITAFLLPGVGSVFIAQQGALKILLYKYDYIESHGMEKAKKIPWPVLLADERERIGIRTLKGMIFPWKE